MKYARHMQHYFQLATIAECKMTSLKPHMRIINLRHKRVARSSEAALAINTAIWELMSMKTEIAFGTCDVLESSHAAKEFQVVASPVLMIIVSQFRWRLPPI